MLDVSHKQYQFYHMKIKIFTSIVLSVIISVTLQKHISDNSSPIVAITANQFKQELEGYVRNIAKSLEKVYETRCNNSNITNCKIKSVMGCEGTQKRICMKDNFPLFNGQNLYLSRSSVVKVPNSLNPNSLEQSLKELICSAANSNISSIFKDIINKNNGRYAWAYIGSRDGALIKYPGQHFSNYDPDSGACKDYDTRMRPWFKQSVYGRKNIIALIGNRNTFNLSNQARLNTVKASVKAVLNTTYLDDQMAIITFADQAKSLLDLNMLVNVNSEYQNSTYGNLFFEQIEKLGYQNTNKNNYQNAINLAFQMIAQTQKSNTSNIEKQYFFMLFTDGNPNQGLTSYQDIMDLIQNRTDQINLGKLEEEKIKISLVGLNLDSDPSTDLHIENWSCVPNGMYINIGQVKAQSQFLESASQFYDYQIFKNYVDKPVWSPIYPDYSGFGLMVTVTYPSYQVTEDGQKRLLAVTGIDVLVSAFAQYSTSQTELAILLNDNGRRFVNSATQATSCQIQIFRKFKCKSQNCSNQANFDCPSNITAQVKKEATDKSKIKFCPVVSIEARNNTGAIVGSVIGVLVGVIIIILVILFKMGKICKKIEQNVPGQYVSNNNRSRQKIYRQEPSGNIFGHQ